VQNIQYHGYRLGRTDGLQLGHLLLQDTVYLLLHVLKPLSRCCTNFLGSLLRTEWIHRWIESHFKTDYDAVTIEICALSNPQYSSPGFASTDLIVDGLVNRPHVGANLFNGLLAVQNAGAQQEKY